MPFSFDLTGGKLKNTNVKISKNGIQLSNGPRPLAEFKQNTHYELEAEYCGTELGGYLTQYEFDMVIDDIKSEFEELRNMRDSTACLTNAQVCGCFLLIIPGLFIWPFASKAKSREKEAYRRAKDRVRALLREKNTQIGDGRVSFEIFTFTKLLNDPKERIGVRVVFNPNATNATNSNTNPNPLDTNPPHYYPNANPKGQGDLPTMNPTDQTMLTSKSNKDFIPYPTVR